MILAHRFRQTVVCYGKGALKEDVATSVNTRIYGSSLHKAMDRTFRIHTEGRNMCNLKTCMPSNSESFLLPVLWLLKSTQPYKTVPPAREHVIKHMNQWKTFKNQTMTVMISVNPNERFFFNSQREKNYGDQNEFYYGIAIYTYHYLS